MLSLRRTTLISCGGFISSLKLFINMGKVPGFRNDVATFLVLMLFHLDFNKYVEDLESGLFIQHTLEDVLMNPDVR